MRTRTKPEAVMAGSSGSVGDDDDDGDADDYGDDDDGGDDGIEWDIMVYNGNGDGDCVCDDDDDDDDGDDDGMVFLARHMNHVMISFCVYLPAAADTPSAPSADRPRSEGARPSTAAAAAARGHSHRPHRRQRQSQRACQSAPRFVVHEHTESIGVPKLVLLEYILYPRTESFSPLIAEVVDSSLVPRFAEPIKLGALGGGQPIPQT